MPVSVPTNTLSRQIVGVVTTPRGERRLKIVKVS